MNRKIRSLSIPCAALLGGTLALVGCQQEAAVPTDAAGGSGYVIEVQRLKSESEESFDAGLSTLDAKFGYGTASAEIPVPGGNKAVLEKAAATQIYTATGDCVRVPKFIFQAVPGDRVIFRANSVNEKDLGISDPVAMLIQFNHTDFIQNGTIPPVIQADFRILEWNDDVATGNLSASIAHTFTNSESGYFMVMAYPYSNASSKRIVSLNLDIFRVNCPDCDYIIKDPIRPLGGLIYRSKGAYDFRADREGAVGDPRLYVIMRSTLSGISNGDANSLTRNSRVFPFNVSAADGMKTGNRILIANESAETATITHTQYAP